MDVKVRTCKFCKKPCTEPKFLPCFHSFCKLCLKFQIIKVPTNRQWEGFSCPSCGTYTKAIDPDQPLASWADQFPDSLTKRKVIRSQGSSEDHADGTPAASPRTPTSARFPSTGSDSTGSYSPGPQSVGLPSPLSLGPPSPTTLSSVPESPGIDDVKESERLEELIGNVSLSDSQLGTPSSGDSYLGDPTGFDSSLGNSSVKLEESFSELSFSSPDKVDVDVDDSVFGDNGNEEKMCTIHLVKPIIVTCKRCNNVEACGQCLIETHLTCRGEDFVPITQKPLLPDVTELEQEVRKVDQANEKITQSGFQLQQTRELIRQKIKQIALLLIQKMKKEEEEMVKNVEKVYHDEIWRLKSGINPSENLLKNVQDLKDRTEDLSKQHPAAVVHQSGELQEAQKDLLQRVKAVDYSCVPPEVSFVPNYDTLAHTLGDLVIDDGYFPKHDIPPVAEKPQIEVNRIQNIPEPSTPTSKPEPRVSPISQELRRSSGSEAEVLATPPTTDTTPAQASSSKRKGSDSSGKSKSKAKSIFDKIRSPKQKQSKFYTKFPEL